MEPDTQEKIDKLFGYLKRAERSLIFTGAGISVVSGIPDYRGPQGLWKKHEPIYYQDFLSSQEARINYWNFKLACWAAIRDAKPNSVHHAIKQLEDAQRLEIVITQNIDGLHAVAGTSQQRLVELHGTDRAVDCQNCHLRSAPEPHYQEFAKTKLPPRCSACGGWLKPATISFGQNLRQEDLQRALEGASKADLVIALGSTLSVYPAAQIPLIASANDDVPYIVINQGETDHDNHSSVSLRLEGDVSELFPPAISAVYAAALP